MIVTRTFETPVTLLGCRNHAAMSYGGNTRMKRIFLTLALIAGIAGSAFSVSSAQIRVHVRVGPPAPRYERIPRRPGPGYSWRAGYWSWNGYRWGWIAGAWIAGHAAGCWVPAHYSHRTGYWVPGHWRC